MARVVFRLDGDADLFRKFDALPRKLQGKVLRPALRAGAKVILAGVLVSVPRRTGRLARAIKIKSAKRTRKGTVGVNVQVGEGDFIGKTFYGGFVQFGHGIGKRVAGTKHRKGAVAGMVAAGSDTRERVRARPFMTIGFKARKERAKTIIMDKLRQGIREVARS